MNVLFIFLAIMLILPGCHQDKTPSQKRQQTYVVKAQSVHKTLFFTGTIEPLNEQSLSFPLDAYIETIHYRYGQHVKQGDVVLTLHSTALQQQYNDALTEYLKAKDSFSITQAKFSGTKDLWQAGLISKNNYLSEKSSVDTAHIAVMQATRKLTDILAQTGEHNKLSITQLKLSNFDEVKAALTKPHHLIALKAPASGLLLYPPKAPDDTHHHLAVGHRVKAGEVFGLVGDVSGVRIEIDIPETDIDRVYVGMHANISGIALGSERLHGTLKQINAQALTSSKGLPSFNALVEVEHLSLAQQKLIKIGMSASIELTIDEKNQLMVPIAALTPADNGQSMVKLKTDHNRVETRLIRTGYAQADKVMVLSGLKPGERIVYDA